MQIFKSVVSYRSRSALNQTSIERYIRPRGAERKGASVQRLRIATLREGIPSAIIGDALRRLEEQLWFLHLENNLYYFSNVVGLNRVIIDKEEVVTEDAIETEFKNRLERDKLAGIDFDAYLWPKASNDSARLTTAAYISRTQRTLYV